MEVSTASRMGTKYEVITLSDKVEHDNCSACFSCNMCLAGKEIMTLESKKYCWKCFEKVFGQRCLCCQKLICGEAEMTFIYYNNYVWHKKCFKCCSCGKPLSDRAFVLDKTSIYCTQCRIH